jgi:hypothetical protein
MAQWVLVDAMLDQSLDTADTEARGGKDRAR